MQTTVYLIRHAQSHPSIRTPQPEWPLSATGLKQAARLGELLGALGIQAVYSSPFLRCRQTIQPFLERSRLAVSVHEDLRERLVALSLMDGFTGVWTKSWEDFDFALPGCESSRAAQERMVAALAEIVAKHPGETIGVSSHGNVIGLLLNRLDPSFARKQTEDIRNPDVLRLVASGGNLAWDQGFSISGLEEIATHHLATPIDKAGLLKR